MHKNILLNLELVCGLMAYFIWQAPYMSDNYVFSHDIHPGYAKFYAGADITACPMTLTSAFRQAQEMYFTWCGRFTGNLAVYLLFMLPKWLYTLIATMLFGLYLWLLQLCIFGRKWRENISAGWIWGIFALIWTGMPSFGEAFLWLSVGGLIALLGQAAIFIPFRFALDKPFAANSVWHDAAFSCLLFLGGLFVCPLDYATSAALPPAAIACLCWLYFKDIPRKIAWPLFWCALGLCLGSIITLCAPGNQQRILITNDTSVHAYLEAGWLERILNWLQNLPLAALQQWVPLLFLVCGLSALWSQYGKRWLCNFPVAALLFILPAFLTHCAYLFIAWPPPRAFATVTVQLIIAGAIIFQAVKQEQPVPLIKAWKLLEYGLIFYCCITIPFEIYQFYKLDQEIRLREQIIQAGKNGQVKIPALQSGSNKYQVLGYYLPDLAADANFWVNRAMSAHYHIQHLALDAPEVAYRITDVETISDVEYKKNKIKGRIKSARSGELYFYYYGVPALLDRLPRFMALTIFDWLSKAAPSDWRNLLTPIFCARTSATISKNGDFESEFIRIINPDTIWLETGKSKFSFDLIPYHALNINGCEH